MGSCLLQSKTPEWWNPVDCLNQIFLTYMQPKNFSSFCQFRSRFQIFEKFCSAPKYGIPSSENSIWEGSNPKKGSSMCVRTSVWAFLITFRVKIKRHLMHVVYPSHQLRDKQVAYFHIWLRRHSRHQFQAWSAIGIPRNKQEIRQCYLDFLETGVCSSTPPRLKLPNLCSTWKDLSLRTTSGLPVAVSTMGLWLKYWTSEKF